MDTQSMAILTAEFGALRADMIGIRQDIGMLEAKTDSIEAWRTRYLMQEDQLINKLFAKIDEFVAALGDMRTDLARIRGERDAERRTSLAIVSLLSAACGGLAGTLFHG
jgi:hypothetical protein